MPTQYNVPNIRTLMSEGFNDEELRAFCHDDPRFKPVFDQLAQETGKAETVRLMIEHATQHLHFEILLEWAKEHSPSAM